MCTVVWMTFCWCAFCLHCLGTHFSLFHFDSRIIISLLFFFLLLNVFHAKYMYIFGNCCLNSGNYVMYDANPTCSYGECVDQSTSTHNTSNHIFLYYCSFYWFTGVWLVAEKRRRHPIREANDFECIYLER